jgi:hypothetical protein
VKLPWADVAVLAGMVIGGSTAIYLVLLTKLRRFLAENQRQTEHRLEALTEAIRARSNDATEPATTALSAAGLDSQLAGAHLLGAAPAATQPTGPLPEDAEIAPPIQAAIAAAAIAVLGNHARVRSARTIPSSDVVSPWTQQGRVIVQSSHNLRTQGSR